MLYMNGKIVEITGPEIYHIMFMIGITAESMTGVISSSRRDMDVFGVIAIAIITALGGGVVRDVLLGNLPVTMVVHPEYALMCLAGALIAIFTQKFVKKLHNIFLILDSIGLIAFAYFGSNIAYHICTSVFEMHFLSVLTVGIMIAVANGIAGGIMRDMICNDIPVAFKSELYATVAAVIGAMNIIFMHYDVNPYLGAFLIIGLGMLFRVTIILKKWSLPKI